MKVDNANAHRVEIRRSLVSELRIKGLTLYEIKEALWSHSPPIYNLKTGKPFSAETIRKDLKVLKGRWRTRADETTDDHQARQLEEINQIKRDAWARQNGNLALRALELETKLLGTLAPTKIELSGNITIEYVAKVMKEMEDAGLDPAVVFERLIQRARYVNRSENS